MNDIPKLIEDNKRLIEYEASKYSKFIPLYVVLAEAYKLAHKAAEDYNPNSGAKFSTHLTNQLKKLSRISTQYGATVRLPENKQFKLQRLNTLQTVLKDSLGRDATVQELADGLGTSIKEVNYLLQHRQKEVNISNTLYTPVFGAEGNDDWLHFVYHDLTPTDKIIFEHKTGFGGKPELSTEELAKKLNTSVSTITNRARMITEKIAEGWK